MSYQALHALLLDIGTAPMLPTDALHALIHQAQAGDEAALQAAVAANLRLVVSIAKPYAARCHSLELPELVSEGTIGLRRAVQCYQPAQGTFSNYAHFWIRHAVIRAIEQQEAMIRLPVHEFQRRTRARRAAGDPDAAAAQGTGEPDGELPEVVSLDLIHDEDDPYSLLDLLPDATWQQVTPPEYSLDEWCEMFALAALTEREQQALIWYYGLDGTERTSVWISQRWQVTDARVRQIIQRAVQTLRRCRAVQRRLGAA